MAEKKSIVESVLMDAKKIQAALDANTKEILRSVTRGEIDGVIKESLISEDDFDVEDMDSDDTTDSPEPTDEIPAVDGEETPEADLDNSEEVGPELGDQETGMDADAFDGDEIDMTSASDDDVIQIYKKLSGEDEIEIVGDEIHLTITEPGEYVVKTNGSGAPSGITNDDDVDIETGNGDDINIDDEGGDDYEIEMDDEDPTETPEAPPDADETPEDDSASEEGPDDEIEEQISTNRVAQNRVGGNLTDIKGPGAKQGANFQNEGITSTKKLLTEAQAKYNKLLVEVTELKSENQQFKEALKDFRNKLVNSVVYNTNLTYATKLFLEHSTTQNEKRIILKRFDDEVTNLIESKKLYKTIVNELATRKPIVETVGNKIIKEATGSASKNLNENTAYVDASTKRIMDLIKRVERT